MEEINVGNYVRMENDAWVLSGYTEWVTKCNLRAFAQGESPNLNAKFKVIAMGPHLSLAQEVEYKKIYGIEDVYTGQQYVCGLFSLRKVPKFEVGDVVVRTKGSHKYTPKGFVGKITSLGSGNGLCFNDPNYGYEPSFFEHHREENKMMQRYYGIDNLCISKNLVLTDIKPFMRVVLRNGQTYIATKFRTDGTLEGTRGVHGWNRLEFENRSDPGYCIEKVYDAPNHSTDYLDIKKHGSLIWQAKPQETEQEKAIRELEENIKASQEKLTKLKETL